MRKMIEYPLKLDRNVVLMAAAAIPRSVVLRRIGDGTQEILLCIETVENDQHSIERTFGVVYSDGYIPENATYIGTVHDDGSHWHVFELSS